MKREQNRIKIKSEQEYDAAYNESIENPDLLWSEIADRISWYKKWDRVSSVDYKEAKIKFRSITS